MKYNLPKRSKKDDKWIVDKLLFIENGNKYYNTFIFDEFCHAMDFYIKKREPMN